MRALLDAPAQAELRWAVPQPWHRHLRTLLQGMSTGIAGRACAGMPRGEQAWGSACLREV